MKTSMENKKKNMLDNSKLYASSGLAYFAFSKQGI